MSNPVNVHSQGINYWSFAMFYRRCSVDLMLFIGVFVGFCSLSVGQPPKVAVDVAVVATEAAKEDQPVLPDDFGKQSTGISATWSAVSGVSQAVGAGPCVTFYTTDGSFRCVPCEKQIKILIAAGGMKEDGTPVWPFRVVKTGTMTVPQWKADSGESFTGAREANSLKLWIDAHAKLSENKSPSNWTVDVDGSDSRAIVLAVAEAIRRQDDAQPAVTGFLPAIPIDLDDDLLKVLDALISKDGYTGNGFKVAWPAGKRRMTFEPGISVRVRKVVEVDATVTAIEMDGREVTLSLNGTIVKTLTVRLK